jgi:hypothetical protein
MNSPDTPQKLDKAEIVEEGSTMERFTNLTKKLLGVSREEILQKEKEYKEQKKINKRKRDAETK